jgi:diaminopimelate epimerase
MKGIQFTKMVASGNDFVVLDNRLGKYSNHGYSFAELARKVCARKNCVGADGLLVIEDSRNGDFRMRIFNPDGSEVDMCGNGSRCAALYAVENGIASKDVRIETRAGMIDAEVIGLRVKVKLTDPKNIKLNKNIKLGKKGRKVHYVNTGVPHAVTFFDNLKNIDVTGMGSALRYHKSFKPKGTNADFVKIRGLKEIEVRTYERGVEAETEACGTGAAASAVVSNMIFGLKPHIDVITKSGEVLRVYFDISKKKIKNVYLEGEAKVVYKGGLGYV